MHDEKLQQVELSLLPGIGPVTVRQLISYCGSACGVFGTSEARLGSIPGIGKKTAHTISAGRNQALARDQLKMAAAFQASIHFFTDESYPHRLKQLEDGPVLLFTRGRPAYDRQYTIGIVGTRRPTPYAISVIRKILNELYHYRPTVISGLAYGVDIAAHLEALKLGLPTIGVMGSGLDHFYPNAHKNIAERMVDQGGLVTELRFGCKPEMYHFPSRNRIIAGLSDVLLVVEARKKGGALITAAYGNAYGKACFAVPGAIDAPASAGCNQLIKLQKARMMTCVEDIVEPLRWSKNPVNISTFLQGTPEARILEVLGNFPEGVHIDRLSRKTQIPINKMGVYLLNLEVRGQIKTAPGHKFLLVRK